MEPEPQYEPQPVIEPEPDFEMEPVIEPGPDFEMEPVIEPEPDIEMEPVVEEESPAELEPEPEEFPQFGGIEPGEEPTVVIEAGALDAEPETEPEPEYDETEELADEGESDPEIKLDLARAYLSLGDKEASKSMLDEVLKTGNEAQKAEARQMLEEL
jgi:FimV-like protein